MKKAMSLRLRVTLVCALLMALCCLLLTFTNNLSAMQMADSIQAVQVLPAQSTGEDSAAALPMTDLEISEPMVQARRSFHVQSILAMAGILTAGILLIYYFVGKALAPLHELTRQIRTRTAENLEQPVAVPDRGDEVSELACSFNQMSQRLNQVFVMQKNFSHNAAHEFRTPLAIMKTRIGLFRKKAGELPPDGVELLRIMEGEVDRLSDMVNSLLELTNLEQSSRREQISAETLLQEIAEEISSQAEVRQVSIITMPSFGAVMGERQMLRRALVNLVENAVKYSPAGGAVKVSAQCRDGVVRFEIADQGPGIPEAYRRRIFEPFFRVDDSRSRRQGGTGLGLALVRAIAESHGGTVRVEDNDGGGSRFLLELPSAEDGS